MTVKRKACALLVQLVERRSPKPDVGGSSPPGRAQKENIARSNNVTAETAENVNYFGYNFLKCSFLITRLLRLKL